MKKILLPLFLFVGVLSCYSQNVVVPDINFRNYLLQHQNINTNGDSHIQLSEAAAYTGPIICVGLDIEDLTGIEAFEHVTFVSCAANYITELDVSHNTHLTDLICSMNSLHTLDLSNNPHLRNLRCSFNPMEELDLSHNVRLKYLYTENTLLSALDVSHNPELLELSCYTNYIETLDLSVNTRLVFLNCSSNWISSLNVSQCPDLEWLLCYANYIPELDLAHCNALRILRCFYNPLTELDVSSNIHLQKLDNPFSQVTRLDLSHNPALIVVYCFASHLNYLNIANGNNTALQLLWTAGNPDLTCIQVDNPAYSETYWTGNDFQFDATSQFNNNCLAGLSEDELLPIAVYPNPTANQVNVDLLENVQYRLTSIKGEILGQGDFTAGNHLFSLEAFEPGIYLFQFTTADGRSGVQKIQKN